MRHFSPFLVAVQYPPKRWSIHADVDSVMSTSAPPKITKSRTESTPNLLQRQTESIGEETNSGSELCPLVKMIVLSRAKVLLFICWFRVFRLFWSSFGCYFVILFVCIDFTFCIQAPASSTMLHFQVAQVIVCARMNST
jgi:hypothetical protein